jgi:hypothetical protein
VFSATASYRSHGPEFASGNRVSFILKAGSSTVPATKSALSPWPALLLIHQCFICSLPRRNSLALASDAFNASASFSMVFCLASSSLFRFFALHFSSLEVCVGSFPDDICKRDFVVNTCRYVRIRDRRRDGSNGSKRWSILPLDEGSNPARSRSVKAFRRVARLWSYQPAAAGNI